MLISRSQRNRSLKQGRNKNTRTLWLGPKSLAIVSCALALLAAQPVMAAAPAAHPASIRISGSSPASESPTHLLIRSDAVRRGPSFSSIDTTHLSTRQLHVLATMEILQRLIASSLRPVDQHQLPAMFLLNDMPAFIQYVAPPMQLTRNVPAFSPMPHEQAFALAHCLLAPPTRA